MRKNRRNKPNEVEETKKTLTIRERQALHQQRHPNDKNVRKEDKGVTWSKITERDKKLKQFHKTHTYETSKGWIAIGGEEE